MNPILVLVLFVVYTIGCAAFINGFSRLRYRWLNRFYYLTRKRLDKLDASVEPYRRYGND